MSDVLRIIQAQLDRVRPGAERRQALAAATPSIWPVTGGLTSAYGSRLDPFTRSHEFHAGLDNAEIAKVLNISVANAGTRLHRAVTRLRKACHAPS